MVMVMVWMRRRVEEEEDEENRHMWHFFRLHLSRLWAMAIMRSVFLG